MAKYLNRLTGDVDEAEDLLQKAFIRLNERGRMPDAPNAWLVSVAHNLFRDQRRQGRRRLELLTTWKGSAPSPAAVEHPGDNLVAEERGVAVRTALNRLSERDRQILLLKHSGFGYAEIATAVNVPAGNVGTYLIRATAAFRRAFAETQVPHASE